MIGSASVIIGVIIGALATYIANFSLKKMELNHAKEQELRLEKRICCANFIAEANRLVIQSTHKKITTPSEMVNLTAHYTNIELLCTVSSTNAAREIFELILSLHNQIEKEADYTYAELRMKLVGLIKGEIEFKT